MLFGAGVVVVAAAVAVTVLVSTGSDDSSAAPPSRSRPASTVQPLRLSKEPLWTSPSGIDGVEELDGLVLMHILQGITLADADTGQTRWSLPSRQELAGGNGAMRQQTLNAGTGHRYLVRYGDDVGVLIEYRRWAHCISSPTYPGEQECFQGPGDEAGLALLSGVDGSVVWQTPIIPPHPADTDLDPSP